MATVEVTDATFADVVLKATTPVLVDYWADWCAPCKQIAPILEELSEAYAGRVVFAKVDTNVNVNTATQQGIMGLPTLQIFVNGQVVKSMTGGKTKSALIKAIDEVL